MIVKIADEKRREYARFLLQFIFLGFLMKITGELIHEMGHTLFVLIFGGRIIGINISVEWPFTLSQTIWKLTNPSNFQLALISMAGIFFDTITTISGQFLLFKWRNMSSLNKISVFWLSFWTYLNSVVYLVIGAFHPFGDIQDFINVISISRISIGIIGFTLLIVYTYSLSVILKRIFIRLLGVDHATELVSIFWILLHLFFVTITLVKFGLPLPPIITVAVLVVIFTWSYISGRWMMSIGSKIKEANHLLEFSEYHKDKIMEVSSEGEIRRKKTRTGYILLSFTAIISLIITGVMVDQYVSAYSLIMKTDIKVEAIYLELEPDEALLNTVVDIYNPTKDNLTLNRIEFEVKLNGKYMVQCSLKSIPSVPSMDSISFVYSIKLPQDRAFTIEEAKSADEWEWIVQGTGYVRTMFGDTLLRFKCKSTVEPE